MNARECTGWLGYALDGSRGRVTVERLGNRVLLLGQNASSLATLFSFACAEAGLKSAILDVDGSVSPDVHGYFRLFDHHVVLYDAFHLEGDDASHGQLVASAYSTVLGLSFEEEAILSSAMLRLSAQNDLATPSALYDVLGAVEGFRGYYVDKLKGRIGALKYLDVTRLGSFEDLMVGGTCVTFSSAPYPQAAELSASLCIAKALHLLNSSSTRPDALLITGAHRLFRNLGHLQHPGRLMVTLLEAPLPLVLASPLPALLNDRLMESMAVRVYSSEAWNVLRNSKQAAALPCSYTVCDDRVGTSFGFVPRFVKPKRQVGGVPPVRTNGPPPALTRTILEEISRFDSANRQSLVSYLAPQFLASDVESEIDRLHSQGFLVLEPKDSGGGPRVLSFTVTESGRRLMQELSR
jgi:hypothetical protein